MIIGDHHISKNHKPFIVAEMSSWNPKNSNTIAWYIWYFTPVSKLCNWSWVNVFFNKCAPKAPKIIAKKPNI